MKDKIVEMINFFRRGGSNSLDDTAEYEKILEQLEKSYSSIQSINSVMTHINNVDENQTEDGPSNLEYMNALRNDQFQSLQLAEMLEKMALELRIYSKRRDEGFKSLPRRKKRRIPSCVTENYFLITLVWQLLSVLILEIFDATCRGIEKTEKEYYYMVIVIMVIFQFSNLLLSMAVTVKLKKQYMHKTASMRFLLQAYVSTLLLFAGMYTFIAKIEPHYFKGLHDEKDRKSKYHALIIFSQLLFMSISTGTLCGSSSVTANHHVTELIMSVQMLLSFIYFASILSQAISPGGEKSKASLHKVLLNQNEQILDGLADNIEVRKRGRSRDTI